MKMKKSCSKALGEMSKKTFLLLLLPLVCLGIEAKTNGSDKAGQNGQLADAEKRISDVAIKTALENEILFDPAVSFNAIEVDVYNGIVNLKGQVKDLLAKNRAEKLAEVVRGVKSVVNRIEVKPAKSKQNGEIKKDVAYALFYDPSTDAYEITVKVGENGRVILNGTVDSWPEKRLATKVAQSVRGVRAVENNLSIRVKALRADSEMKKDIEQQLRWSALVGSKLINVEVNKGVVSLSGKVGSLAEKSQVVSQTWVAGVKKVKDEKLTIDPSLKSPMKRSSLPKIKQDGAIAEALRQALAVDPRVNSFDVNVEVENGVVTLRGGVHDIRAQRAAANTARNTMGVLAISNKLRVRSKWNWPDERIKKAVDEALLREAATESIAVNTKVIAGVVRLSGTVDSYFEKAQVEDVVSRVKSVREIDNNLVVSATKKALVYNPYVHDWYAYDFEWYDYRPTVSVKSDKQIQRDIKGEFFWSPFIETDQVQVQVKNGHARLTGEIDSWSEYRAATENAYEGGATWVDNDLKVREK